MILLMLLAAFVWWPLPGQAVEMATVRGESVAQLSSTAVARAPAAVTLSDSWARAPVLPFQAATAPAADGSLAAAVDQAPALAPVFTNPTKLGGVADNIAGDDPFTLQLPETASSAAVATTAPFVLGPPQPLPSATPPASEPAQAAAAPPLPTAMPTTVPAAPTASPTVAPSPTLVPTLEPTPVPTVAVAEFVAQPRSGTAYIHTGALNIRSGPGLGYSSLDVAYNREPVQLLAGREDDPWVLIRLGSGTEGWVNVNYLVFEPQP
jgi:hypothetical protein